MVTGEEADDGDAHIHQAERWKSGDCPWKAVELTAGDLEHVTERD
jgi:hypothetical protein